MLFGQSIFQSVLDRLDAEDLDDAGDQPVAQHRIHGLNNGFAADVRDGVSASSARPDQAYLDNLDVEAKPSPHKPRVTKATAAPAAEVGAPAPPVMPKHLTRLSAQAVAGELDITSGDTVHTLGDKRRAFAKVNHPDGVDPLFRENATIRMKIANLLIDEAIRQVTIRARLPR